jgi:lipopolysaccharide export LptBFGC system permease protein LptF
LYVVVAGALMVVFALIALFALRHPARASLRSWSLIMTGFATAGAFTHLAGSAYVRHEGGHVSLWAASLLPALVFGVLAWWLNRGALRPEPVRIS